MLDYHDDIVSDLSALHHVADWRTLDSPTFFTLVARLPYYQGVVRARLLADYRAAQAAAESRAEGDALLYDLAANGDIEFD